MAALADLPDVAARVSAALTAANVPHAVSGAMAMAAQGFIRTTRDVDVLVAVPAIRLPEVFAVIRGCGFQGEDAALIESYRNRSVAAMTSGPTLVEILAPVLPYHHEVLRRAVRIAYGNASVPFVTLEDLIVLKMLWMRDKDRADVRGLLAARRGRLDVGYLRRTLASLLPAGEGRLADFERWAAEP